MTKPNLASLRDVIVPVIDGVDSTDVIQAARALADDVLLVGIVSLPADKALSSGAVKARAAHRPSRVTLITANSSVIIHGPPQNGGWCWSGTTCAEIAVPSGRATATLRGSRGPASAKIR